MNFEQISDHDLEKVAGGNQQEKFVETIHEGDVFCYGLFVYQIIRLYSQNEDKDLDVFECKYWDNYGNYRGGRDYTNIEYKNRSTINLYEKI